MPTRQANLVIPLNLSYDTRGMNTASTLYTDNQDQRRINCYQEVIREGQDGKNELILTKRPGITVDAGTYGSAGQTQYVIGSKPTDTWGATPWVFTKDGSNNIKVHDGSTSTTILTDSNYQPRFFEQFTFGTTKYATIQLQHTTTPTNIPAQKIYYSTGAIATWTELTDTDIFGGSGISQRGKMEVMDNIAFIAGSDNRIWQSGVSNITAWSATEYMGRTINQDAPQGLMKVRNQLLFFGEKTVEIFVNQGNATGSILGRVPYSAQAIGLGQVAGGGGGLVGKTSYYATLADMAYFVGRYDGGTNHSLIKYDGQKFTKVSRPVEDKILSSNTIYSVQKISFNGKTGVGMQLTLPTASTQRWLMYFPDINDFIEWDSADFSPVNNGDYFLGIRDVTKLYKFNSTNNWRDNGNNYTMTIQFRLPLPDTMWHRMAYCGVIADSPAASSNITISFSDDDGVTWSTGRTIDLYSKRKDIGNCGAFMQRLVRITYTDQYECRLRAFYAQVD